MRQVLARYRLVLGEAEAGLDFGEGGGADAFDFEEVVGLGEGAGGDDAFGEFGADFGEGAEGFDGGGVDVDWGCCGIFTKKGDSEDDDEEGDEADTDPAHLGVALVLFLLTFFDEFGEGFAHGLEWGWLCGRSTCI